MANLLDFPNELLCEIILYTDLDDQKSLKMTCRKLHTIVVYCDDMLKIQHILKADEDDLYIMFQDEEYRNIVFNKKEITFFRNNIFIDFIFNYCEIELLSILKKLYKRRPKTVYKLIIEKINNPIPRFTRFPLFFSKLTTLAAELQLIQSHQQDL